MLMRPRRAETDRIDVDFSLAIHNRTGKYFIGQDLIELSDLSLGDVYYWFSARAAPPTGLGGRVLGRLQHEHIRAQALGGPMRLLPRRHSARPLLHLDPFTVPSTILRPLDAVLIHDLGQITHPQLFDDDLGRIYERIYAEIARVGPHLIFVSEASRAAFGSLYSCAPASVRCIYPAIRTGAFHTAPRPIPAIDRPFLLTVGSIGDRKNQRRCIQAYAQSGLADAGIDYVLCGGREPGFESVRDIADSTAGVIRLGYVDDAELSWLYARSLGFVLVSQLEGFGMPVAEAIARGAVPLVTRGSVLEEVAGEGALRADAENTADIAAGMRSLAFLGDGERSRRKLLLEDAISRFEIDSIRQQWRAAFNDILAFANAG